MLQPFDILKMQKHGTVLNATIPKETFEERLTARAEAVDKRKRNLVNAEQRTRLIYYPAWVIKYAYRQRLYHIVVDGYRGEIIAGRAPQREDQRIPYMLAICMFLSIPLGKGMALLYNLKGSELGEETFQAIMPILFYSPYILITGHYYMKSGDPNREMLVSFYLFEENDLRQSVRF